MVIVPRTMPRPHGFSARIAVGKVPHTVRAGKEGLEVGNGHVQTKRTGCVSGAASRVELRTSTAVWLSRAAGLTRLKTSTASYVKRAADIPWLATSASV